MLSTNYSHLYTSQPLLTVSKIYYLKRHCFRLLNYLISVSLSTSTQVTAGRRMAVSVCDAPTQVRSTGVIQLVRSVQLPGKRKAPKHNHKDALNNLVEVGFFLSLFLRGGFLRWVFFKPIAMLANAHTTNSGILSTHPPSLPTDGSLFSVQFQIVALN